MLERHELEAFLTLAEELHFGRTAERLRVTTSRISQTIGKLERRIGSALFERNSRTVALTPLGRQLRDELRPAYEQITASVLAASRGGSVERAITAGFSTPWCGNLLVRAADLFRIRYPGAVIGIEEIQLTDPLRRMRSGAVDLQLTAFPIAEPDIMTGAVVFTEPRGLMVPEQHPFAAAESVSVEDLADTKLITLVDASVPRYWMDCHFPRRTPAGRSIPQGPATTFWAEVLVHVSQGVGVSTVALRAERFHSHPGIVFVPFRDAPNIDYGLMWPRAGQHPLVPPFLETITEAALSA
ncbi:putative LysR family transcriptional regulator [Nocardia brasiliensis NBRC 14402]|uniref:LysR family transcriptional regulator n=1 Tax=Nocardia brasiliensis TaxID=37326 RepID=UPI0002FECE56|nr:LysR family transcriptional regulator [Nocardia brasiliensis]ASF09406.1 LysR family transcriptional regulator [Nocardia brasiliensis]GAJ86667.1 putative LysR family transcriptional regulator [Nocardia brasiliensis NBRC 14402]SUB39897.1 Hca operon transcriptional activator [Nocardia brasiliensis]